MGKVWSVGSIGYDLFARTPHLPTPGETVAGTAFMTAPGGKGLNQAIAAARMGASVSMAGCVGDDAFGSEVMAFLQTDKIDLANVKTLPRIRTGTALIFVATGGENCIVVVPGANGQVSAEQVTALPLETGDVVQAQFEIPMSATCALLRHAGKAGATSILNPSPVTEGAAEALRLASIIVLNEVELAIYSQRPITAQSSYEDVAAAARSLRATEGQVIITTLGPRGAVAVVGENDLVVTGIKTPVVDTTGAGDTFTGTLAAALLRGTDLAGAIRMANQAAALSVGKPGAAPSIPYLKDLPKEHTS